MYVPLNEAQIFPYLLLKIAISKYLQPKVESRPLKMSVPRHGIRSPGKISLKMPFSTYTISFTTT